jgi:hypothetical protein
MYRPGTVAAYLCLALSFTMTSQLQAFYTKYVYPSGLHPSLLARMDSDGSQRWTLIVDPGSGGPASLSTMFLEYPRTL